jgi:predicted histone-like DNA-binding protein
MKYIVKKETKPKLPTFGKYKAVACHRDTVETSRILSEVASRNGLSPGTVVAVMTGLASVISDHLRQGDRVRLDNWGLMKLEIESQKVDASEEFSAKKHIRGVRLHFIPESSGGSPELYKDLKFEREHEKG